ncbi:MAG: transcriptional activator NhaR [Planctomycetota bacterium]
MEWLNYHHLLYFWMVAREGTIQRAAEILHVGQPTISTQLRKLETAFGQKLFRRAGRTLELTEAGQMVLRYADEIYSLGRELTDTMRGHTSGKPVRLVVGIVDAMPKLMVRRLLEPALQILPEMRLVCVEDPLERLLAELTQHRVDLVLSDSPVTAAMRVKAFNHSLGESAVGVFGSKNLAKRYRRDFPQSLTGAPLLLPARHTALRRALDAWLDQQNYHPQIRGEFEDRALMKAFGQTGEGLFPGTMAMADEIIRQHEVELIGELANVKEQFFAITAERKLVHPAVQAISDTARKDLFI